MRKTFAFLITLLFLQPVYSQSISTSTITGSPFCAGTNINVSYTITGTFNAGNIFTAQLSNGSGSFSAPVNIGSINSTAAGTISATIPSNTPSGTGYRLRVVGSNPSATGGNNGTDITIDALSNGGTVSSNQTICSGNPPNNNLNLSGNTGIVVRWEKDIVSTFTTPVNINNFTTTLTPATIGILTQTTFFRAVVQSGVCTPANSSSVQISVDPKPNASVNESSDPICEGDIETLTASATGGSGFTFLWNTGAISSSINLTAAGTVINYTVIVTNSNFCKDTVSSNVAVNQKPNASVTESSDPICQGDVLTLTASSTGGSTFNFLWNTGAVSSSINLTAAGTAINYSVIVTNNFLCKDTVSGSVAVTTLPTGSASSPTKEICSGTSVRDTLSSNPGGGSFTWTTGAITGGITGALPCSAGCGTVINDVLFNPSSTASGSVTYTVTPIIGINCAGTPFNVVVTVRPKPSVTWPGDTVCAGLNLNLVCAPTGGTPGYNFAWSGPVTIPNSTTQNPTITNISTSATGSFTIIITDSKGCKDTATSNVLINPKPSVTWSGDTVCQGKTIQLISNLIGGTTPFQFVWKNPSNTTVSNSQNDSIVNSVTTMSGNYIVFVTDINGCKDTATSNVLVNPLPTPQIIGDSIICQGLSTTLSSSQTFPQFSWSTGASSGSINVTPNVGDSLFTLTVTDIKGCVNSVSESVHVIKKPVIDATTDKVFCDSSSVRKIIFTSTNTESVSHPWTSTATNIGSINFGIDSIPAFFGNNNSNVPISKDFFIIPTNHFQTETCAGVADTFKITINPIPQRSNLFPADSICSGTVYTDTIIPSFTSGVTFAWSCTSTGSTGGCSSQQDAPNNIKNDALVNPSNTVPSSVTYNDTLIFTGGGLKCKKVISHTVKVNPAPASVDVGDFTSVNNNVPIKLCGGTTLNSFNILGTAPANILWTSDQPSSLVSIKNDSVANTVVTFNNNGTNYTANLIAVSFNTNNLGGCPNKGDTVTIQISNDNPISEAEIIEKDNLKSLVYTDDNVGAYQWGYDSVTNLKPVIIPDQVYQIFAPSLTANSDLFNSNDSLDLINHFFWVMVFEISGADTCRSKIYFNGPYKTRENAPEPEISPEIIAQIIPNPNNGKFNLQLSGNIYGIVALKFFNSVGQLTYQTTINKFNDLEIYPVDVAPLADGFYFITINGNNQEFRSTKFIKN